MKQSVRKRISMTKLTLARIKYIREHSFHFASYAIGKRKDIHSTDCMHKDTMVIEAAIEAFFKAICRAEDKDIEETDKIAIDEYSMKRAYEDEYLEKLTDFVELETVTREQSSVTPEDRMKEVEEYRRTKEISDEWDEEQEV